ncbi:MAG TPA: alpha/beta fold hydrolase [Pseudonocardiaceae bacterium]
MMPGDTIHVIDQHTGSWLRRFHSGRRGPLRLVCLPHAVGSASDYRGWHKFAPDWVDVVAVQYPGHDDRYDEQCDTDIQVLASRIAARLLAAGDGPVALFGHGMGSLVAYETAVQLHRRGAEPVHLAVSGQPAPSRHRGGGTVHSSDDDLVATELLRRGIVEPAMLADPERREAYISIARADYYAMETYQPSLSTVLSCPVTSYYGLADSGVKEADAGCWYEATYGRFQLRCWPGDHFYLRPREQLLVRDLTSRLTALRPAA